MSWIWSSVSDAETQTLYLRRDASHGEWYYSLLPRLAVPEETVIS